MRGGGARGAAVPQRLQRALTRLGQAKFGRRTMTLTVNDTILDEEFRTIQTGTTDDDDTASLAAGVQAKVDLVSDSGDFYSAPTSEFAGTSLLKTEQSRSPMSGLAADSLADFL